MNKRPEKTVFELKSLVLLCVEIVVFIFLLFSSAGRFDWWDAWAFLGIVLGNSLWISWWLYQNDPDLLKERLRFSIQKEQPFWDKFLMSFFFMAGIIWCVIAGLDAVRYNCSAIPLFLKILGAMLLQSGFLLQLKSFQANRFLVSIVSFQEERGHKLVADGPYQSIRHPFYAGAALLMIGGSLLLGSWFALLLSFFLIGLLMIRIQKEELMLVHNLEGYGEYQQATPFKLIPFIW